MGRLTAYIVLLYLLVCLAVMGAVPLALSWPNPGPSVYVFALGPGGAPACSG